MERLLRLILDTSYFDGRSQEMNSEIQLNMEVRDLLLIMA